MYPSKRVSDPVQHLGVGTPPVHEEWRDDTSCEECQAYMDDVRGRHQRNFAENWGNLMFASVPGGASVARLGGGTGTGLTPLESERKFQKDMDSYADSKKAGLQPDKTTVEGVERAEQRAESFTRVERDANRGRYDLSDRAVNLIREAQGGTNRLRTKD